MAIGFGHTATRDLTHVGLVLAPRRVRGAWLARVALVVGALATGAGIGYVIRDQRPLAAQQPAGLAPEAQQLRQQLEQTRLALRLADARSQELEHQIDALNQRLRESTDELTFFRKAREGKH